VIPLQILLATLLGSLNREQRDVIAFLREEKATFGGRWRSSWRTTTPSGIIKASATGVGA
jgi:hypothetical protein